jgi:hypothetical protein
LSGVITSQEDPQITNNQNVLLNCSGLLSSKDKNMIGTFAGSSPNGNGDINHSNTAGNEYLNVSSSLIVKPTSQQK